MFVPSSTSIRRARVAHIDADRLFRRASHLRHVIGCHDCQPDASAHVNHRHAFITRAAELAAVEDELAERGLLHPTNRRTNRSIR